MKKCSKCEEEKPLTEFHKRKGRKCGVSKCKRCVAKYHKEWYGENKESRLKTAAILRDKSRLLLWNYLKDKSCADCGERNPIALEFDHISDDKTANISYMILSTGWENVLKEINKCEIVCANCHSIRTARRANTFYWTKYKEEQDK